MIRKSLKTKHLQKADTGQSDAERELAEILFLKSELDEDLKLLIERWPNLSVELKQAIVRMME